MKAAFETAEATGFFGEREQQRVWARTPISQRLVLIRKLRHAIAARCHDFTAAIDRDPAETLVSEVLPLADACRYLERRAETILKSKWLDGHGRPGWLSGTEIEIRREPFGIVLVIGPGNYPLFLPGVQAIQALAAGNAVVVKPGRGGLRSMELLAGCARAAGFPQGLFSVTGEDPDHARRAVEAGVDKVILTGSHATGMSVMSQLASFGTPAVMELSGFDPVFVREGADLGLVIKAVRFGLQLNSGQTCIAPKIVYASPSVALELQERF
ncbi:MAG: aldehyde dehydrogenase family protein, partial [Bryobacteraceae bacterium]|nr:aldehyde dehydrogenase family protein [Bryobacteraceae bacterium]